MLVHSNVQNVIFFNDPHVFTLNFTLNRFKKKKKKPLKKSEPQYLTIQY